MGRFQSLGIRVEDELAYERRGGAPFDQHESREYGCKDVPVPLAAERLWRRLCKEDFFGGWVPRECRGKTFVSQVVSMRS